MLTHLSIRNYALVDQLDLEFNARMTAITGETGAGKSIMLDALGLCLGNRTEAAAVRQGQDRADICASFDVQQLPVAQRWLREQALEEVGALEECLLRRTVTSEGRSRAFINGQTVTAAQLKDLGRLLIGVHAQHEHQSLLNKEHQRRLLDNFGQHKPLLTEVKSSFHDWQNTLARYQTLQNNLEENTARVQLLSYQVEELDQLNLLPGELKELETEQRNLANGESVLQNCRQLSDLCAGSGLNLVDTLNQACQLAKQLPQDIPALREASNLLASAQIQVEEAQHELEHHIDSFQLDPERLQEVEDRLSSIFDIARKHRIKPGQLLELHQNLQTELQSLTGADGDLDQLDEQVQQLKARYQSLAEKLSKKRRSAAKTLAQQVNQQLKKLAMEHAKFQITFDLLETPKAHGHEDTHLLISTNPGQPAQPLSKVASGGELSRISLAIQVVTAQTSTTPTLIFDEVDVGIGGATANVVGALLRQLGDSAQVLCVTHLAQVAGKAHQHIRVNKLASKSSVTVDLETLDEEAKISEIARMIGSNKMTQTTLDHARELLAAKEVA